ncbi:MAG: hypothetical protein HC933_21970 [Pleurocapsa sp. SU_196_0]|nr:hypothetical protein [Pleurocapsa sp. SU_196_0]
MRNSGRVVLFLTRDQSEGLTLANTTSFDLKPGQSASYTFSGTAGDRLGLAVMNVVRADPSLPILVTIYQGATYVAGLNSTADDTRNLPPLPVTGSYRLEVDGAQANGMRGSLILSKNVGGTLQPGLNAFMTTLPGQNASFSFPNPVSTSSYNLVVTGLQSSRGTQTIGVELINTTTGTTTASFSAPTGSSVCAGYSVECAPRCLG